MTEVNLAQPEFFKALARLSKERPAAEWQVYLRWHVLRSAADKLPAAFNDESFDFNERIMKGRKAQPPRHCQVITAISGPYGAYPMAHAIGQIYVDRAFQRESKARAMEVKIGYPDKWRDFSDSRVGDASFVDNWMRANQYDALDYGSIGMVIGHEITHGFDDTGRKYDARGNLADWWTAEDAKRYEERAKRMVRQYGTPTPRRAFA